MCLLFCFDCGAVFILFHGGAVVGGSVDLCWVGITSSTICGLCFMMMDVMSYGIILKCPNNI